jgi:hypothetical protein
MKTVYTLAIGPFYKTGKANSLDFFQIGSYPDTRSLSSDFRPSVRMFAINFLLEIAMHEGFKILQNLNTLYTHFSTPDLDHSKP